MANKINLFFKLIRNLFFLLVFNLLNGFIAFLAMFSSIFLNYYYGRIIESIIMLVAVSFLIWIGAREDFDGNTYFEFVFQTSKEILFIELENINFLSHIFTGNSEAHSECYYCGTPLDKYSYLYEQDGVNYCEDCEHDREVELGRWDDFYEER